MTNILLSICIPTYNRSELLCEGIKRILLCPSDEIEIVVSDNASSDSTQDEIKKINDPRLKYYRNEKNLGYPLNILKLVERAIGNFILFVSDEDRIATDEIPWILHTIKTNESISQILGSLGWEWAEQKKLCNSYEDKILKSGYDSLTELFWDYSHGSGMILKRKSLDLNQAKKYLGTALEPYMDLILETQAMAAGDTLCTSKILCYIGKTQLESRQPLFQGKPYSHPVNRVYQLKEKIRLIYDNTNDQNTQKALLIKQMRYASNIPIYTLSGMFRTPYYHFYDIMHVFYLLLSIKYIRYSPYFWINLPLHAIRRSVALLRH